MTFELCNDGDFDESGDVSGTKFHYVYWNCKNKKTESRRWQGTLWIKELSYSTEGFFRFMCSSYSRKWPGYSVSFNGKSITLLLSLT